MVGFYDEIKDKSDIMLIEHIEKGIDTSHALMIELELHRRFAFRIDESIEVLNKNVAKGLMQVGDK